MDFDSSAPAAPASYEGMDFDQLQQAQAPAASTPGAQAPSTVAPNAHGSYEGMDFDAMQQQQPDYSTPGQMVKTGIEGAAKGALGPLAPMIERGLDIMPNDIKNRAATNPITHGVSEATGLVGTSILGFGEGAIMGAAGHAAADVVGLGNAAAEGTRLSYKIGSEAVKQAAEMAVFQGSDEVSKMVLKDPETASESAIANIGLSAAIGGIGGGVLGAVSPLWSATGGKALDKLANGVKNYWNGGTLELPENLALAFKDLNIEPSATMRSALSGDVKSAERYQNLMRAEHPEIMAELKSFPESLQKSVTDAMGVNLTDTLHFSNDRSGEALGEEFRDIVKKNYDPLEARFKAQEVEQGKMHMPDETRLGITDQLGEASLGPRAGLGSPAFKEYEQASTQILHRESVADLVDLSQTLGKTAYKTVGIDPARQQAIIEIKGILDAGIASHIEKAGLEAAGKEGGELALKHIQEMQANKAEYKAYAEKQSGLLDFLGLGKFKGTGNMTSRVADLSNEQLLKKFMAKGDVQGQKFIAENFPTLGKMAQDHEAQAFLAKSVDRIGDKATLDVGHLSERIASLKSTGHPEYADYVVSPAAQAKIDSAKQINDALKNLKNIKNSGTPAGMAKVFRGAGSSALAGVAAVAGQNPIGAYLIGEAAHHIGKTVPEAVQLGMLKFMGSGQPVRADGLKAMVDFIHQTIKGESLLSTSAKGVFKAGAQVLAERPSDDDRKDVDKAITKLQDAPGKVTQLADHSHLGHYLPDHQTAVTAAQVRATQYLQSIKPQPYRPSALDAEIQPSDAKMARYNRALDIAAQPAIIMQHIKDGTLQSSDIKDIQSMFPALAKNMAGKLSTEMTRAQESGQPVPYRTKVALAMFLGTPVDSTMSPTSIIAAQPQPAQSQPQPAGAKMHGGAKAASAMSKDAASYRTGSQAREAKSTARD